MQLPILLFKDQKYFVDERLREFRSAVDFPEEIEFISFFSKKGEKLLKAWKSYLNYERRMDEVIKQSHIGSI